MKNLFHLLFPILFLSIISVKAQQHKKAVLTNLDIFQMEYASDPQISPDGLKVVYVRNGMDIMKDRKKRSLWLVNTDGSGHQKLTSREVGEGSPRWSPDGSRIAFISGTDDGAEIYVYWLTTGRIARLTQLERSPGGLNWSPDGKMLAFSMLVPEKPPMLVKSPPKPKGAKWADPPRVTTRLKHEADGVGYVEQGFRHLFVIPADGGMARQITHGDFQHRSTAKWTNDSNNLILSSNRDENWEYNYRNSEIYSVNIESEVITALTDRNGPDHSPSISPDSKKIAYLGFDDKLQTYQVTKLYLMNLDGSQKKEIVTKLDRSLSSLTWNTKGDGLYFLFDNHGNTKIGFTDLKGKTSVVTQNVGGTAFGRPYGGGSYSLSNNEQIAYTYTTPEAPSDVMVVQKASKQQKQLTNLNSDLLDYRELGAVEEIWYKSTVDKRDIQGWIVKPPYFDGSRKYPLLVENHGGPVANYGDRFSPEIQLFAADGYVVFYPNPRGSTSYGEEFGNLLYHNYPGDDYHDVMDGVDAVLKNGYVSEDSLFVTGGSAGGIMTAWIIGSNNRFRAAAVVKPVMNWVSKTLVADNYFMYYESRYPGKPWEEMATYMKFSPISLVGNIQTPTLVMVGMSDLRTPSSEAKQLYHALKVRKIETALVEIPGAYHLIVNRPSQLITKVDHILAWFAKYRK